jgi:hypothetical protein
MLIHLEPKMIMTGQAVADGGVGDRVTHVAIAAERIAVTSRAPAR